MRRYLIIVLLGWTCAASAQLYRWTDERGRVHLTDTPPPAGARNIQKREALGTQTAPATPATPFVIEQVTRNFPVTLYSSPGCDAPCKLARDALNRRGIPFKEVQVWDQESNEKLKQISGSNEVPVLTVGQTVYKGFAQSEYDTLLNSAGYPREGLLPARSQPAPAIPDDYATEAERAEKAPVARPVTPEASPAAPKGPYAPR